MLNSRPGAAYTIYLDFAGFTMPTGQNWAAGVKLPYDGNKAVNPATATGTFNAAEQAVISQTWASMADKYRNLDVNITTVDPAVAAGQSATDAQRLAYYDSQVGLAHTIITPTNTEPNQDASGLSAVGSVGHVGGSSDHTNFNYPGAIDDANGAGSPSDITVLAAHENGHILGLSHQSDYAGNTLVNEYGNGDFGGGHAYNGIMAAPFGNERSAFRLGDSNNGTPTHSQNDVSVLLDQSVNPGLHLLDSGKGHSFATATPLSITTGVVDVNNPATKGLINPASAANPQPIGIDNYTKDFFSFASDGISLITLTANDGTDLLTAGLADGGITLRSILNIYDASFSLFGTATDDASTLFETYSGTLPAGLYFAEITSYGGHAEIADPSVIPAYNPAYFYDSGAYFLTGSGFAPVPEPASFALLAIGGVMLLRTRRVR